MQDLEGKHVFLSLVVPAYNEEEMIAAFYARTAPILSAIDERFEILFVNDGSSDHTVDEVRALHVRDRRVKLIEFSRHFGKEIAMTAGLDLSSGEVVVITDADLQDPPELIPQMVARWRDGYDVVYATRTVREGETFWKKFNAKAFYFVMKRLSEVWIPENTGDFRLMDRRVVDALKLLKERHRFMKGLFSWVGFKQVSIPYRREPRLAGNTKWNYWRLRNFALEGITSFTHIPLQVSFYLGSLTALSSFAYAAFLVLHTLISGNDLPRYPSLMVAILFFGGAQLMFLGLLGEYLGRVLNETKRRPLYLIQDLIGMDTCNEHVFPPLSSGTERCRPRNL
jgi:polyisoprenyl-phosphate glycosyltransferase